MYLKHRAYPAAAVAALLGVAAVIGGPAPVPGPNPHAVDILLTAVDADPTDIVIDFVRHGQTTSAGFAAVASQGLPGHPLSELGYQEAQEVGEKLFHEFGGPNGVAGIFIGQNQRMGETAAPFASLEHMTPQEVGPSPTDLAGLDEIGGGVYAEAPTNSPGDIAYELTVLAWILGLRSVPLPGSNDYIGMQFEENFGGAVDSMYQHATDIADPVISANGHITDVAFSGEAAISTWTLMNVDNPDIAILLPAFIDSLSDGAQGFLPNVGQVEIEGNPTDGWTLLSFNGTAMPADPGLLTELVVDLRNLITAPQQAAYNVFEALLTGDSTTIDDALQAGLKSVGDAIGQFPGSVIGDIVDQVKNLGTDVAGGQTFTDAFDATILGLVGGAG